MRKIIWLASSVLLLICSRSWATSIPTHYFYEALLQRDLIAHVTILSSKTHIYRSGGVQRTCGRSYEAMVHDLIKGGNSKTIRFTTKLWGVNDTNLHSSGVGLAIGEAYLVATVKVDGLREVGYYRSPVADSRLHEFWKNDRAARKCLASLPPWLLTENFEVESPLAIGVGAISIPWFWSAPEGLEIGRYENSVHLDNAVLERSGLRAAGFRSTDAPEEDESSGAFLSLDLLKQRLRKDLAENGHIE